VVEELFQPLAQFVEEGIPFNQHLGVKVDHLDRGEAVLRIPWAKHLIGDVFRGAIHGGVLSMLIDTTGGAAVFSNLMGWRDRASTVDLRVDYLRPVPGDADIVCAGRVLRMGNKVAVTQMEIFSAEYPPEGSEARAKPLVLGKAVYNVLRSEKGKKK